MVYPISRRSLVAGAAVLAGCAAASIRPSRANILRTRRNASTMLPDDPFFTDYAEAVRALHELEVGGVDGWRRQALIHIEKCPHGGINFLPWHRHYLALFETICGELIGKPDFALAYWDWTADDGKLPEVFFANGPLNVAFWNDPSNAQSDNWWPEPVTTVGTRNPTLANGLQKDPVLGGSFAAARIDSIRRLPRFGDFWQRLEGSPHNNGHVVAGGAGGHIGDGMSPLDPCFWLHHCNVDRRWAEWQRAGNVTPGIDGDYAGDFVTTDGTPVAGPVTADGARDFVALGFTYDTVATTLTSAGGPDLELPAEADQTLLRSLERVGPRSLASAGVDAGARPFVETALPVEVPDLVAALFAPRVFRPLSAIDRTRFAVGSARILARLSDVRPTGGANTLLTNVFVNCPYLSPETPYADVHYADTFSFFMPAGAHDAHGGREVLVDITEPLRQQAADGRISTERIEVQLMPLPANPESVGYRDAGFTVGKIEILAS